MNKALVAGFLVSGAMAGGAALHAMAQETALEPGRPTRAEVWVQNKGNDEAIPVRIEDVAGEAPPLQVEVVGIPADTAAALARLAPSARQQWEYREVRIPSGQAPSALLNASGAEGWEATGVVAAGAGGDSFVIMKRPR